MKLVNLYIDDEILGAVKIGYYDIENIFKYIHLDRLDRLLSLGSFDFYISKFTPLSSYSSQKFSFFFKRLHGGYALFISSFPEDIFSFDGFYKYRVDK